MLLLHGLLHLMGHDHERGAAEAAEMARQERAVLAALGWRVRRNLVWSTKETSSPISFLNNEEPLIQPLDEAMEASNNLLIEQRTSIQDPDQTMETLNQKIEDREIADGGNKERALAAELGRPDRLYFLERLREKKEMVNNWHVN